MMVILNLLSEFERDIRPGLVGSACLYLNESYEAISSAFNLLLPDLVSVLAIRANLPESAVAIDWVLQVYIDTFERLPRKPTVTLFADRQKARRLCEFGGSVFDYVFGETDRQLAERVAQRSGINFTSATLLIRCMVPFVFKKMLDSVRNLSDTKDGFPI